MSEQFTSRLDTSNTAGAQSKQRGAKFLTKGNLAFGALAVPFNMAGGDDVGTAVLRAGAETALWYTAPWAMGAYTAATTVPGLVNAGMQLHKQRVSQYQQNFLQGTVGGNYQDTQRALTMRQAAVQAIQGSKLNARSAFGGEARILSNGWSTTG